MLMRILGLVITLTLLPLTMKGVTLTFSQRSAVVWKQTQLIEGKCSATGLTVGTLLLNGSPIPFAFSAPGDSFAVSVKLAKGTNTIVATVDSAGVVFSSDTLKLTMGYGLRPEVYPYATVSGQNVTLHATVMDNPNSAGLSFFWSEDPANPRSISISSATDSVAACTLPAGSPSGEYYFNLLVAASSGDTIRVRTFVTLDSSSIRPFKITTDHAGWIDGAIVYGITPYIFVANGRFSSITAKIPELAALGVNALWIQPTYSTYYGGQGYDVIDYFKVRPDLGSENDLRTLVRAAHAEGLRVILDFVPNHSSLFHPYAQDAINYGPASHYYDFYQRAFDIVPYSMHYHTRNLGKMTFVYYFWEDLPNLNYQNPEVERMIIEAGKYWIEKFDIDGYRVDAVWGVNARNPDSMKRWRIALKRVKPEILLLAEDKATWGSTFDERFDAAYDWGPEESWVSHWVWQPSYSTTSNPTIFNYTAQNNRSAALRSSLTNGLTGYPPRAKIFRFMENNDTFRFRATHDDARTRMVATMLFSLNGIPLLFNGQEIGASTHPYSTSSIFRDDVSIKAMDQYNLFQFYQKLIGLRKSYPALHSQNYQEVSVSPGGSVFAYRRWEGSQNTFTVLNMGNAAANAVVSLPVMQLNLDSTQTYYLTDLLSGQYFSGTAKMLQEVSVPLAAYTARLFILADSVINTTGIPMRGGQVPMELALQQNYPNPFNPTTSIQFDLPRGGHVSLKVYDVLGREVESLAQGEMKGGHYQVTFDGWRLASGVYFYVLQFQNNLISKKMLLLK
jgi:cyclomaltodextrinase / maltogenic alpha-amylase / neopullulanase